MTARQVAEVLGVHENWVYDQAVVGGLPSYKIGGARRFDAEELRDWIEQHRQAENGRHGTTRRSAGTHRPSRSRRTGGAGSKAPQPEQVGTKATPTVQEMQPRLFEA